MHPTHNFSNAHAICAVELRLGRIQWTRADYLEEGRRQFDVSPIRGAHNREVFAAGFADIAMPPAKLSAWRLEAKAARDTEFGDAGYRVGLFGPGRAA